MNMKKTIAALAACAVATSAMATTVSAFDAGELKYNLVKKTYKISDGSITYKTTVSGLNVAAGETIKLDFFGNSEYWNQWGQNTQFTITGTSKTTGGKDEAFSYVLSPKGRGWQETTSAWVDTAYSDAAEANGVQLAIPVGNHGIDAGEVTMDITVTMGHTYTKWDNQYTVLSADMYLSGPAALTATGANSWGMPYAKLNLTPSGFSAASEVEDVKYPLLTDANTYTNYTNNVITAYPSNIGKAQNTTTAAANGGIVYYYGEGFKKDSKGEESYFTNVHGGISNILDYLADPSANLIKKDTSYINVIPVLNDVIANYDDVTFTFNTATDGISAVKDYASKDAAKAAKEYEEAVENYKKIFASFDAAKADKDTDGDGKGDALYTNADVDAAALAMDAAKAKVVDQQTVGYKYDGNGDKTYMQFGQHLYNLYGDETTNMVGVNPYDFSTYNLFAGAMVINGNLTMSLQDTNVFDYGASSISFNWADAVDGATAAVNTYATYLTKMQLATSTIWFWDNMVVTFANTEAPDVGSGAGAGLDNTPIEDPTDDPDAGLEGSDDTINDDPADDPVDDPVDDPADDPVDNTPVVDSTPVVSNPGTGNAPIALAVIPVALAAAAVVAKKRG